MKFLTYEELPDLIRSIYPKSCFHHAVQRSEKIIRVKVNYDGIWDTWILAGDKWSFAN